MIDSLTSKFGAITLTLVMAGAAAGCEKKPPDFVAKSERGAEAVVHYDDMSELPKYLKVKKSEYDKKKAIMDRRISREQARGIFRKDSKWGY